MSEHELCDTGKCEYAAALEAQQQKMLDEAAAEAVTAAADRSNEIAEEQFQERVEQKLEEFETVGVRVLLRPGFTVNGDEMIDCRAVPGASLQAGGQVLSFTEVCPDGALKAVIIPMDLVFCVELDGGDTLRLGIERQLRAQDKEDQESGRGSMGGLREHVLRQMMENQE